MSKTNWKNGPLPKETYGFGGVVLNEQLDTHSRGFYFADFRGDKVIIHQGTDNVEREVLAHEVGMYNNSLDLPPNMKP